MEIPHQVTARPDTGLWNAKLGIWLFLASEVMLFGGLFSGYVFLRMGITEGIDNPWPSRQLPILPGFINTLVLIASSVFVVLAWASLKMRNFQKFQFWMRLVVACALVFLGIKVYEYSGKFTHHGMKFTDDSVVQGVLKEDRIAFKATSVTIDLRSGHFEFLEGLKKGSAPALFKTPEGETITLSKSWVERTHRALDQQQGADYTVSLEAVEPLQFRFKPRRVKDYSESELTYRDSVRVGGELIYDQIYFEVHEIDLRMAKDKENAIALKYLGEDIAQEFLEHRELMLEKRELGGRHADPIAWESMHLHAGGDDAHGENGGYPVIEVERADKKFLSNHGPAYSTYYAIYFTLTGLHGLHVLAGALVLSYFLFFQKGLYKKNPEHLANRVEVGGLFWHFVDLVWIFLFPVMYLL
ncbi:MAG: heme-copper oxidase subunit III [Verrucomicrobiales bacterium]